MASDGRWYPPQGPVYAPPPGMPPVGAPKRRVHPAVWIVLAVVLLVGGCTVAFGAWVWSQLGDYSARVDRYSAAPGESTVSITFTVRNDGDEAGSPLCTVYASDPSGRYEADADFFADGLLDPGEELQMAGEISFPNGGAEHVSEFEILCF